MHYINCSMLLTKYISTSQSNFFRSGEIITMYSIIFLIDNSLMTLASIITIGDELLIGQTIDTNSALMAEELNKIGVCVKRRVAVGDGWQDIWYALDVESRYMDVILITGELG